MQHHWGYPTLSRRDIEWSKFSDAHAELRCQLYFFVISTFVLSFTSCSSLCYCLFLLNHTSNNRRMSIHNFYIPNMNENSVLRLIKLRYLFNKQEKQWNHKRVSRDLPEFRGEETSRSWKISQIPRLIFDLKLQKIFPLLSLTCSLSCVILSAGARTYRQKLAVNFVIFHV